MLVTFSSPAYANVTMFGDIALHLLKLTGSGSRLALSKNRRACSGTISSQEYRSAASYLVILGIGSC